MNTKQAISLAYSGTFIEHRVNTITDNYKLPYSTSSKTTTNEIFQ